MKKGKENLQNEDVLEEVCPSNLKAKLAFIVGQDRMSYQRAKEGFTAFEIAKKELFEEGYDGSVAWVEWKTRLQRIAKQERIQEK